jgi:hypothetical protein
VVACRDGIRWISTGAETPISSPENIPMNDKANPRDAAISAFRQREAEAARTSSQQTRAQQERARQQETNLTAWSTRAFGAISMGVMHVSDDFARRGSPFIIRQRPDGRPGIAGFEVHRSGSLHREAALAFGLDTDGVVRAETDARGADLLEGIAVDGVTPEWAEKIAEQVMLAVLGGQRTPIPGDDANFMSAGYQTYVPNQPRSGRSRRRNG